MEVLEVFLYAILKAYLGGWIMEFTELPMWLRIFVFATTTLLIMMVYTLSYIQGFLQRMTDTNEEMLSIISDFHEAYDIADGLSIRREMQMHDEIEALKQENKKSWED